jgi:hypothetical protein
MFLQIVEAADGKTISEIKFPLWLPSSARRPPAGSLYISLVGGTVSCASE